MKTHLKGLFGYSIFISLFFIASPVFADVGQFDTSVQDTNLPPFQSVSEIKIGNGYSGTLTGFEYNTTRSYDAAYGLGELNFSVRQFSDAAYANVIGYCTFSMSYSAGSFDGYQLVNNLYDTYGLGCDFSPSSYVMILNFPNTNRTSFFSGINHVYSDALRGSNTLPPGWTTVTDSLSIAIPYFSLIGLSGPTPTSFYAQIKNTGSNSWNLRNASSTSSNIIKTLPEDWIVHVASTTDDSGNPIIADGYQWYQVTDPTDDVSGWIAGADASNTVEYLPYDSVNQANFEASSSDYIATSSRPDLILGAIDHYYATSTGTSLYDNTSGISSLAAGFPEQVIPGIAAQEDGGSTFGFNNENVSSDYGHGIMQITFSSSHWDNRGIASDITIPDCEAVSSSLYTNCYTAADSSSPFLRHYQPYGGTPGNPTYKYYTNTLQSIYSNVKDGLDILSDKYGTYSYITTGTTTDSTFFSADDRKDILATENYNGTDCGYVDDVATKLDNITDANYFPNATTSAITSLISKMHTAGGDVICADLHSPAVISIQDSSGRKAGVIKGETVNDFPLAVVDPTEKVVKILAAPDENYTYRVEGTANATYGIGITIKHGNQVETFHGTGIPTHVGEVHTYTINKQALIAGRSDAVTVQIDTNGDGSVDKTIKVGPTVTGQQFEAAQPVQTQPQQLQ